MISDRRRFRRPTRREKIGSASQARTALLLGCCAAASLAVPLAAQDLSRLGEVPPVSISGSIQAQGRHYASSLGNTTGRPDMTGTLALNAIVSVYGVQLPVSLLLTTSESTFRQPFNEFGISPRYKWITAHFGYRSIRLSQYSLSYQRWLGAGVEVRAGKVRISTMYGRFQKATDEDTVRRAQAIYGRMGYGILLGYGSNANYCDLALFKAWDDSSSVSPAVDYSLRPSPAENAVIALSSRFTALDNRLTFDGELAGSAYTRDLGAPAVPAEGVPSVARGLVPINTSTRANYAMRGALTYSLRKYRISLRYERVGPNFVSMGVGYVAPDREDITIAPTASPFSFVRASASLGLRRDNLDHDKLATTHRVIAALATSWYITNAIGFDFRYANYSTSSSDGVQKVTDTTRIENVSTSISGGPRFTFGSSEHPQSVSLFLMHQRYDDRNVVSGALNNNSATSAMAAYGSMIDEYQVNGSVSYSVSQSTSYSSTTIQISAGATKRFYEDRINATFTLSYGIAEGLSGTDRQLLPVVAATYTISERDLLSFNSQLSQNARTNSPYTEVTTSLGYSRTF